MQNERNTDVNDANDAERERELEEAKEKLREAGDLYGSDMARDDRALREQRADIEDPNIQH